MESVSQTLSKANLATSESSYKPYREMTADERRAYVQQQCDWYNEEVGNLNAKDGYECAECKNRGIIYVPQESDNVVTGERDFVMAMRNCKCKAARASIKRMKESGLGDIIARYTFDRYKAEEKWQANIKQAAQQFAARDQGVFFIGGQSGCGKTHICTAITSEFLRKRRAAYYMIWQEEVVKLKAVVTDSEEYNRMINRLKNIDVLYIDDFFKPVGDNPKPTAADIRLAYEIINHRYNSGKFITVISSERYIQEILEIDEATGGRIVEYAGGFMFNVQRNHARNYRLRGIMEV